MNFTQLGIDSWLSNNLKNVKITKPTEIQIHAIPNILKGKSCVCSARTGFGKTACFVLPILNELKKDPYGVFAVVLAPTRELAYQIEEQFKNICGTSLNLNTLVLSGGRDIVQQSVLLNRKPHIIIACVGRFYDLLTNCDLSMFKYTKYLVIDECDRVLNSQNMKALTKIASLLPNNRQNLLFSATMTKAIKAAVKSDTFVYECAQRYETVDRLTQFFIFMPFLVRDAYLFHLLTILEEKLIIVFMPTTHECAKMQFISEGFDLQSEALHGAMTQQERLDSLYKFKSGKCKILFATDVASRGLDIPYVDFVISFSPPNCATDYIHRVGRTARAGQKGNALTLVSQHDIKLLLNIEQETKVKMVEFKVDKKQVEDEDYLKKIMMARSEAEMHLDEQPKRKKRKT